MSGTGIAGLTLGGGIGWLTRAYGLTVDNLLEADIVTAAGEAIHASATEHDDLFWALRGGGGNFGVVTSFVFGAVPLGPDVFAGTFIYRRERWADALRGWDAWAGGRARSDDLHRDVPRATARIRAGRRSDHGHRLAVGLARPRPRASASPTGCARAAPPDEAVVQPTRWTAWQSQADGLFPKGVRAYWKNTSFDQLDDATIAVIVDRALEQTWRGTAFDIHHLGGAFGRVPPADTPFPDRSARYWLNIYGFWTEQADDADRIAFVRGFAADMEPLASGGRYVNFLGAEDDRADPRSAALAVFGPEKLRRLADVKRRYDPDNVFRLNHNIPPGLIDGQVTARGPDRLQAAVSQLDHRRLDPPLTRLGRLGIIDGHHESSLVAVRQPIEERPGCRLGVECRREIRRDDDLARLGVELELDVHGLSSHDAGGLADVVADADHEPAVDRRDRASIGEAVDRHLDRRLAARPERVEHLGRDLDPGGGLARGQDRRAKAHGPEYAVSAAGFAVE